MKKNDLIIFLIALLLLVGMLITIFFGGEKSRHGVGVLLDEQPAPLINTLKKTTIDLSQSRALQDRV